MQQINVLLQEAGMRKADVNAVGELAGDALAAGGTLVRDMHGGIASRPFGILGPWAAPVRVVHDGVAQAVYGGVRHALRLAARGGAGALAARAPQDAPPLSATRGGSMALGALNGLYGNHL